MDLLKAKKYTILSLCFWAISYVISFILLVLVLNITNEFIASLNGETLTNEALMNLIVEIGTKTKLVSNLQVLINIPFLIFYIITIVNANKIKENRTIFILLIVGIFVAIVGIVGLFLFLNEIKKMSNQSNDDPDSHVEPETLEN